MRHSSSIHLLSNADLIASLPDLAIDLARHVISYPVVPFSLPSAPRRTFTVDLIHYLRSYRGGYLRGITCDQFIDHVCKVIDTVTSTRRYDPDDQHDLITYPNNTIAWTFTPDDHYELYASFVDPIYIPDITPLAPHLTSVYVLHNRPSMVGDIHLAHNVRTFEHLTEVIYRYFISQHANYFAQSIVIKVVDDDQFSLVKMFVSMNDTYRLDMANGISRLYLFETPITASDILTFANIDYFVRGDSIKPLLERSKDFGVREMREGIVVDGDDEKDRLLRIDDDMATFMMRFIDEYAKLYGLNTDKTDVVLLDVFTRYGTDPRGMIVHLPSMWMKESRVLCYAKVERECVALVTTSRVDDVESALMVFKHEMGECPLMVVPGTSVRSEMVKEMRTFVLDTMVMFGARESCCNRSSIMTIADRIDANVNTCESDEFIYYDSGEEELDDDHPCPSVKDDCHDDVTVMMT